LSKVLVKMQTMEADAQISRSVPPAMFQSLVVTLVPSRLDYGNAVLVGLPR